MCDRGAIFFLFIYLRTSLADTLEAGSREKE